MAKRNPKKDIPPVPEVDETVVDEPVEPTPEDVVEPAPEEEPIVAEDVPPPVEEPIVPEEPPIEGAEGVATPDGRGVLPYSVIQAEREAKSAAEAKVTELEVALQQVEEQARSLQEQLKQAQSAPAYQEGGEVEVEEEEDLPELGDLEDLSEDEHGMLADTFQMPSVASAVKMIPVILKHIKAQNQLIRQLVDIDNERYQSEQSAHEEQSRAAAEAHRSEIEEALDNLPLARHYQAAEPEAWADFISFHDDKINTHPEHSKLPHGDRFRKALDMAKAIHGDKLGLEAGGKVAEAPIRQDGLSDEPKELPEDVSEMPIEDRPLKTDTPEMEATAKKPVSEWTEAELRNKAYETKPKVPPVKKSVTTLGALPGGEAVNLAEKGPAAKRLPPSEISKLLAEAAKKGDKALEQAQRELLA
jgi:hypothetical protein